MPYSVRRTILAAALAAAASLTACSGGSAPAQTTSSAPPAISATPSSSLPVYPSAPTKVILAVVDFSDLKTGCEHPCTAPVRVDTGNSSPNMVEGTGWPCEYFAATGTGYCIDAVKAKQGFRDQVGIVCRKLGNPNRQDGNLSGDSGVPTRNWFQAVIPKEVAAKITYPAKPVLAPDGTYRGLISAAWLRKAGTPLGATKQSNLIAPDC